MDEEGGVAAFEERPRMADAAAGLSQEIRFVGDKDRDSEIILRQVVPDLVGEVVDIDGDLVIPRRPELGQDVVQQGFAADGDQGLRHAVR